MEHKSKASSVLLRLRCPGPDSESVSDDSPEEYPLASGLLGLSCSLASKSGSCGDAAVGAVDAGEGRGQLVTFLEESISTLRKPHVITSYLVLPSSEPPSMRLCLLNSVL